MKKMYDIPKVIGNRVLVEVALDSDKEVGFQSTVGIIIPDAAKERRMLSANVGTVVQVGTNAIEEGIINGDEVDLMPGHIVKFLSSAGIVYQNSKDEVGNDRMFRIMGRGDIMAIVGEEE